MTDPPKLHAYAVACAFGAPNATDPPARLGVSVWVAYRPEEATAMAMDKIHRAAAAAGEKLAIFVGQATYEITEDHLSHMLNALRTGGKGATVLQAVAKEPPQREEQLRRTPPPPQTPCAHAWLRDLSFSDDPLSGTWRCNKCGETRREPASFWPQPAPGDPA